MILRRLRIGLWVLAAAMGALLGALLVAQGQRVASVPPAAVAVKRDLSPLNAMITQHGQPFTVDSLQGRPFLLFYGFMHCPDICPTTLFELTDLMAALGATADRLQVLFVTVDPERDSQELLGQYMTAFDPRILALRGTPAATQSVVEGFGGYARKEPLEGGDYTMAHTAGVLLFAADGTPRGTLDYHEPREARLAKLRRLTSTENQEETQ